MNRLRLILMTLVFLAGHAVGQSQDLGATITAADAALGSSRGEINVPSSGTISEGKVTLSPGHELVCAEGVTISLTPGSFIYQSSDTTIKNCTIAATSTPVRGEVQSSRTSNLTLDHVTFVGGGNLVYWENVEHFTIDSTTVDSITAYERANNSVKLGIYLFNCSFGTINKLSSPGFVFPKAGNISAVLDLAFCHDIKINNSNISHVDASYIYGGSLIQVSGSSRIDITGGSLTHSPNCDGITTQSLGHRPSTDITIIGVDASYDGEPGQNAEAPLGMGDGIDLINTRHALVSKCICRNSGYIGNQQPAIWVFLDDDLIIKDSDLSDSSMGGIDIDGSPNVQLINNTINRNQASGLLAEWQAGTATNVGTALTFVDGVSGGFGLAWSPGTSFTFDGIVYQVATVPDSRHLTLATAPPDHASPANWSVESSNLQITGGTINDNGLGKFGGQVQVGMSWADSTSGTISGVTSIDTGAGTQLFALELANTATAFLSGNTFVPNILAGNGVSATPAALSPAELSFASQAIGTTSSSRPVTFTAGAVGIQNLVVKVNGDFSETNNCPSELPGYATCQILVSFSPTVSGTRGGALTVSSGAMNDPIIALTGSSVPSTLGFQLAAGTPNAATVAAGTTAQFTFSIGGSGIGGVASLTCAGLPAGMNCNVPATQTLSPIQATNFIVSVSTKAPASNMPQSLDDTNHPAIWATLIIAIAIFPKVGRQSPSRRFSRSPYFLFLTLLLCSCGDKAKPSPTTKSNPARTYTITVTAKVGALTEQQVLTLTVE